MSKHASEMIGIARIGPFTLFLSLLAILSGCFYGAPMGVGPAGLGWNDRGERVIAVAACDDGALLNRVRLFADEVVMGEWVRSADAVRGPEFIRLHGTTPGWRTVREPKWLPTQGELAVMVAWVREGEDSWATTTLFEASLVAKVPDGKYLVESRIRPATPADPRFDLVNEFSCDTAYGVVKPSNP